MAELLAAIQDAAAATTAAARDRRGLVLVRVSAAATHANLGVEAELRLTGGDRATVGGRGVVAVVGAVVGRAVAGGIWKELK